MRHRKRSGKNSTSLTVFLLTIAEEQGVGSRVAMTNGTSLPHETACQHSAIIEQRA